MPGATAPAAPAPTAPAADPTMAAAPADPMMADPTMGGAPADPTMADPAMDGAPADPAMEEPTENKTGNPQIDFISSLLGNMSPDDLDAVEAYAKSVNNKSSNQGQQVQEAVTFTKGQLDNISETFRKNTERDEDKNLKKKEGSGNKKNSPFSPKRFK